MATVNSMSTMDMWPRELDTSGDDLITQDEMPPVVLTAFVSHIDKLRNYVGIGGLCFVAAALAVGAGEYLAQDQQEKGGYRPLFAFLSACFAIAGLVFLGFATDMTADCIAGDVIPGMVIGNLVCGVLGLAAILVTAVAGSVNVTINGEKRWKSMTMSASLIGFLFIVCTVLSGALGWLQFSEYAAKPDAKCLVMPSSYFEQDAASAPVADMGENAPVTVDSVGAPGPAP